MTVFEPGSAPAEDPPLTTDSAPAREGAIRRGTRAARQRYEGSAAESLWGRLDAMDFINRGMIFAAVLLLCFLPFFIVINALAGRSAVDGLSRHLGLNHQAAKIVSSVFASSSSTSSAITVSGAAFCILGAIAVAASIQELYERSFGLERRGMRDLLRQVIWIGVLVAGAAFLGWAGPWLRRAWSGPVLLGVVSFVLTVAFWWWTMHFLLSRRVGWREVLPSAIATAVCWLGMGVVFSFTFSNTVISNDKKYGSIGVVFALMSWFIGIGVVIILGAIFGVVWRERELGFSAAFRRLRRRRPAP